MNKVILMGRLTRDPEVRYSQAAEPLAIARYTLAVDRRGRRMQAAMTRRQILFRVLHLDAQGNLQKNISDRELR